MFTWPITIRIIAKNYYRFYHTCTEFSSRTFNHSPRWEKSIFFHCHLFVSCSRKIIKNLEPQKRFTLLTPPHHIYSLMEFHTNSYSSISSTPEYIWYKIILVRCRLNSPEERLGKEISGVVFCINIRSSPFPSYCSFSHVVITNTLRHRIRYCSIVQDAFVVTKNIGWSINSDPNHT